MSAKKIFEPIAQLATLLVLVSACAFVAWECWPHVGRWHKRRLADQFAVQIEAASDNEAKLLVHELASLELAAIDKLVAHTLSPRAVVADTARAELDDAFANQRILLMRNGGEADTATLVKLAGALAARSAEFGPQGR